MIEHTDAEIFLAWFLWRCRRYEIRSRWTRGVAEHLMERNELDLDEMAEKYDFENIWEDFKPKGK